MTVAGLLAYRAAEDVSANVRIVHVWKTRIMLDEVRMKFVVSVRPVNGPCEKRRFCRRNERWKKRMI